MAFNRERTKLFSTFLKSVLIINIMILFLGMAMLFVTSDTYGIYAASICAASALFNSIGLTLIMRWHHSGVAFVVVASLLSAIALSFTCAGWLTYVFGSIGIYIPYIFFAIYIGILLVLMFQKRKGISACQQMDSSLDWGHFRHIYQLSAVVLVAIFSIAYFVMPHDSEIDNSEGDDIEKLIANVPRERLDSPDVTIEEVVSFEKQYNENNSVGRRDKKITSRIFALKHLLLSGLMPEIHDRDNLVNICMIHAGAFSKEQQSIIDWYLALSVDEQSDWNVCDKATSISDFKNKLTNRINKRLKK